MPLDTPDKTDIAGRARQAMQTAQDEARTTLERLRAQADEVVEKMKPRLDAVSGYVRDEPTKSMLTSAAVGAGLMAVILLMTRSGTRSSSLRSAGWHAVRDAAKELADRAQGLADDTLATAQKRSRRLLGDAEKRAEEFYVEAKKEARKRAEASEDKLRSHAADAADEAKSRTDEVIKAARAKAAEIADDPAGAAAEAWKAVREYADPALDRLRPQFEAAARYARDEPTRTAIGVATGAAILIGLVALSRASRDY
jgi:ElaB/YqjD/DUF883 family membrane-anchored ribosome-binding protein